MELPTSIDMFSPTPPKPTKVLFCCCIKMEPLAYLFHIFNFVLSTTFVGLIFLFIVDWAGWIDAMVHNVGGYWYAPFLKITFCLSLDAVVMCMLSLALAYVMQKHKKLLIAHLSIMLVLNVTALLIIAITTIVRVEGSWYDNISGCRNRLLVYGGWVVFMVTLGRSFFWTKSAEEIEGLNAATFDWRKIPA